MSDSEYRVVDDYATSESESEDEVQESNKKKRTRKNWIYERTFDDQEASKDWLDNEKIWSSLNSSETEAGLRVEKVVQASTNSDISKKVEAPLREVERYFKRQNYKNKLRNSPHSYLRHPKKISKRKIITNETKIAILNVKSKQAEILIYRIPLFSGACFNTMSRIFGAWSNIDLTIPMGHKVDTY
ncbi:hypothetical protein BpHYR1_009270 [Brachionus plicatilis]|uniref:Uncharacterized protein n=1 Tax=Brachionus plicatilis TaxID=10195 RepID=A0A3M7Q7A3_BRAPC|nr:hypothetical protein BpHYR1_009270 [Brachionus plicatilis]